jgi:hypothetical protein
LIRSGLVRRRLIIVTHVGEIRNNRYGTPMKIVQYNSYNDVVIEFQDEHKYQRNTTYENFKKGVSNPYDLSVCGKGYIGEGKYSYQSDNKVNKVYDIWKDMLRRCYSDRLQWKYPAYYGIATVCDEWLNLQNICQWYDDNIYEAGDGGRMHIDKDILYKGNTLYSPDKCIIVPQRINMIFMKKGRTTDIDLPIGISRAVSGYSVYYNTKNLGIHKNLDEAMEIYLVEKRLHIREVVKEYGNKLPDNVINALLSW